jgi:hypothetical protein
MAKNDNTDGSPKPSGVEPDFSNCRAKFSGISDLAYCLVNSPVICKYAEPFHGQIFCFHPNRLEIIARMI